MLASVANNQDEREARDRVMAHYSLTSKGRLLGLKAFADEYIPALREGKGFSHIGQGLSVEKSGRSPQQEDYPSDPVEQDQRSLIAR